MERFLKIPHRTFLRLAHLAQREHCLAVIPVYLALLYHADSSGRCFPGYRRIQTLSGVGSRRTLSRVLRLLEVHGFLSVVREKGEVNHYCLTGSKVNHHQFPEETGVVHSGNQGGSKVNQGGSLSEPELDPFNYTQLTRPRELYYGRESESDWKEETSFRKGRKRPFGPPDDPTYDEEYYRFP
ncbi:MAG: helix-turn-helix domain-containing protein [Candidatus Caldatribacteriaceae bacterium]